MSAEVQSTRRGYRPAGSSVHEYLVTFGVRYNTEQHPVIDHPRLADGYLIIEAPDYETARRLAFALLGQKFSMIYDQFDRGRVEAHHPLGELARYSWDGPGLNTLPDEDAIRFITN